MRRARVRPDAHNLARPEARVPARDGESLAAWRVKAVDVPPVGVDEPRVERAALDERRERRERGIGRARTVVCTFLKGSPRPPPGLYNCPSLFTLTRSRLTLCDPTGCGPPGSFVRGIFRVRMPEWPIF